MEANQTTLARIADVCYLTKENALFTANGDFIRLSVKSAEFPEDRVYDRVLLRRALPFDDPEQYISVQDPDAEEIGIIRDIKDFPKPQTALLREELNRTYYMPVLLRILSIKDRFGYSYWKAETDEGTVDFAVRDTFANLIKLENGRIIVNDVDGNRYDIPDKACLDKASLRKIELYL